MGTIDSHKVFVEDCEKIFEHFRELTIAHVHCKRHGA
jgi:hypothetical protein